MVYLLMGKARLVLLTMVTGVDDASSVEQKGLNFLRTEVGGLRTHAYQTTGWTTVAGSQCGNEWQRVGCPSEVVMNCVSWVGSANVVGQARKRAAIKIRRAVSVPKLSNAPRSVRRDCN